MTYQETMGKVLDRAPDAIQYIYIVYKYISGGDTFKEAAKNLMKKPILQKLRTSMKYQKLKQEGN